MPRALILVVDGVSASFLGPYGNTWIETPAWNQLAAESWLAQRHWAPGSTVRQAYDGFWGTANSSILHRLAQLNATTRLVSDEAAVLDHPLAALFLEHAEIAIEPSRQMAADWQETYLARAFAEVVREVETLPEQALLWVHLQGLGRIWDAPWEFRSKFAEEDDPEPYRDIEVPSRVLPVHSDPDELHGLQCAYAGQVELLDHCLEVLLSLFHELDSAGSWCTFVTSSRGFPLGQHRHIGWKTTTGDDPMYSELLHVPLIVRYPRRGTAMERAFGLTEFQDVGKLLESWFSTSAPNENWLRQWDPFDSRIWSIHRNEREVVLRTPVWIVRFCANGDASDPLGGTSELYLQPDDYYQVNNVAIRCPHIVDQARRWLAGAADEPLPEELLFPLE